ncbi:hypothetical protein [Oceanobacillus halotolerans]|uniref:hypothetical protein n=1 Tax=Oceanobacillus halotolerans TaxID=2663380 RepID=UPI0013DD37E2|nr:hypothetical protein [Oceanobacillus halotolerans]
MAESVSLNGLKVLIEQKMKKKILIKVMWNETEKITLFIVPNMKINSFIYDEKEGYLFYDLEGQPIEYVIPCVLTEDHLENGKVKLDGGTDQPIKINHQPLSKEDKQFLREY